MISKEEKIRLLRALANGNSNSNESATARRLANKLENPRPKWFSALHLTEYDLLNKVEW